MEVLTPDAAPPLPPMGAHRVFRWRNVLAGAPIALCLAWPWSPHPPAWGYWGVALFLAICGALLRAGAVSYCNYGRGRHRVLATGGPYAWLRNPLYVGNLLLIVAAVTVSARWWLPLATALWAALVYDRVVRHEEAHLRVRFGDDYAAYCARVSRWRPRRPSAATPPMPRQRSFERAALVEAASTLILLPVLFKELGWLWRW